MYIGYDCDNSYHDPSNEHWISLSNSQGFSRGFSGYIGCPREWHLLTTDRPLQKNERDKNTGMLEPLPVNKRMRFMIDSAHAAAETDETIDAVEVGEVTETVKQFFKPTKQRVYKCNPISI